MNWLRSLLPGGLMGTPRVDTLARKLAAASTRRELLARLAVLPVTSLLAAVFLEDAADAGRRKRRVKRHKHGDNRRRRPRRRPPCQANLVRCGKACVDPGTDAAHCGACNQRCAPGETCQKGACTCQAAACAGCCAGGSCQAGTSAQQCGRAGAACTSCSGGRVCQDGACICPAGQDVCGGLCVDLRMDAAHCGACGTACPAGTVCDAGVCRCTPMSCIGGCCDASDACLDGRSLTACGRGGVACAPCKVDEVCRDDALGGICLINQPPVGADASFSFDEGIVCGLGSLSGTDPEGDALAFQLDSEPAEGKLFLYDEEAANGRGPELTTASPAMPAEAGTGSLRLCYAPDSRFFHGPDSFLYTVADSHGAKSSGWQIQITILDIN